VAIQAKVGDKVVRGQTLVNMEAMKMEHAIKAPADGVVTDIFYAEGDQVAEGAELIAVQVETESEQQEAG
jgi:3-methylcrotonyl-CoA carboxylase alpha subunit